MTPKTSGQAAKKAGKAQRDLQRRRKKSKHKEEGILRYLHLQGVEAERIAAEAYHLPTTTRVTTINSRKSKLQVCFFLPSPWRFGQASTQCLKEPKAVTKYTSK
ncbi:Histone H2B [Orchesella cincta]|uniref:Histone H2B n=1 Tax=Orchesella cincta TaxID=48709 RepID=A0A1D2M541_ORCCI|nr:Histone H2B [Orchesella cincta]